MVDNMDFKEILQDDINNAFLDSSEFAEVHNVTDGTETGIYGISQKIDDGLYKGDKVIYISTEDTKRPPPGNMLVLDNIRYTIVSTTEQCGMYMVVIRKIGVR